MLSLVLLSFEVCNLMSKQKEMAAVIFKSAQALKSGSLQLNVEAPTEESLEEETLEAVDKLLDKEAISAKVVDRLLHTTDPSINIAKRHALVSPHFASSSPFARNACTLQTLKIACLARLFHCLLRRCWEDSISFATCHMSAVNWNGTRHMHCSCRGNDRRE